MIKNLPILCLTFFSFCAASQNFSATYGFADVTTTSGTVDPGTTPIITGLTFNSFSYTGPSANPSASGRFSFTNWPTGGVNGTDDYSNFTGVLSPTVYYEVSISIIPGYTLSLNTLTFSVRRSGTGIRNYCVRSSLDGYTNNLAASTGTATKLSIIPGNAFFWNYDSVSTASDQKGSSIIFGNEFKSLTQNITFRFFAWNAESPGGSFSIDNVSFIGSALDTLILLNLPNSASVPDNTLNLHVFPNPCKDGTLQFESSSELESLELFSSTGEKVYSFEAGFMEKPFKLDLRQLRSGIYWVRVNSSHASSLGKIILQTD